MKLRLQISFVISAAVALPLLCSSVNALGAQFELLGKPEVVSIPGLPNAEWVPDGHIPVLRVGKKYYSWLSAGPEAYRVVGDSLDTLEVSPTTPVTKRQYSSTEPDNGGLWIFSVFKVKDKLIAFNHAEDHLWNGQVVKDGGTPIAYKSVQYATSEDYGVTWNKGGAIVTDNLPKPKKAKWSGVGDHSVVAHNGYYWMFFSKHRIHLARAPITSEGRPGSWQKYYKGSFSEAGIGGQSTPVVQLPGGNPSVTYNTHLKKFVMVYHTWGKIRDNVVITFSDNGLNWSEPTFILKNNGKDKYRYATIISEDGDRRSGATPWIYFGYWPDKTKKIRQHMRQRVKFSLARTGH